MSLCLFLLLLLENNAQVEVIKEFEQPLDVSDESLNFPYSFDFASDGRLFIADRWRSRLLVWNKDGSFVGGFCDQGKGPGQLYFPMKIAVDEKHIYLWEPLRRISVFDLNIKFIRHIKFPHYQPRVFAPLKQDLFILGFKGATKKGPVMGFSLAKAGEEPTEIKMWEDTSYLKATSKELVVKAFPADIDLQADGKGSWYMGYSDNRTLYQLNGEGKVIGEKKFPIPSMKIADEDIELYNSLSFPRADGKRVVVSKVPNYKINYDHEKAFYNHFLIKGDKILFVQTPMGGQVGFGNGFSQATYFIHNFKTGELLSKGRYAFREDSMVLFRDGRILGLLISEEEDFEVRELAIKGL